MCLCFHEDPEIDRLIPQQKEQMPATGDSSHLQIRVNSLNPGTTMTDLTRDLLKSDAGSKLVERFSVGRLAGNARPWHLVIMSVGDLGQIIKLAAIEKGFEGDHHVSWRLKR